MTIKLGIDLLKLDLSYLESKYLAYIEGFGCDVYGAARAGGKTLTAFANSASELGLPWLWDEQPRVYRKTKSKQPRMVKVVSK
jgi:hypothetical protein